MTPGKRASRIIGLFAIAGALTVAGARCGSSSTSRESARDQTADAVCGRLNTCQEIHTGGVYDTLDSCEIDQKSAWEKTWPAADCEGKIDETALGVCLSAISGTNCNDFGDAVLTFAKCTKAKVCVGASTSADGGT